MTELHPARLPLFRQSAGAQQVVLSSRDHAGSADLPRLGMASCIVLRYASFPVRFVRPLVQVKP